ncbi:MAG TPA: hypothetical protein VFH43_06580 [Candidatus Kapabacteria bacterium]|nr:hypothetical protein [Candidatus Kapabacteria bacterium]
MKNLTYNVRDSLYGIGVLGALVYFIQHASSFLEGVVGVIYAIFWPGVIVYKVLELLKM